MTRVLIAGAGIAGLATRIALAAHGIRADLAERDPAPRDGGTGLYLPANAVRALAGLGLADAVEKHSVPIERQEIRDSTGAVLTSYGLKGVWGDVGESRALSRTALHGLLLDAAGPPTHPGVREASPDGTVTFTDGSESRYDIVIGADGIDSAVRRSAFPAARPRFLGQVCWRFLYEAKQSTTWSVLLGDRGRSLLTVPVGDGQVYCFAAIDSTTQAPPPGDWRDLFADFATDVPHHDAHFAPLREITGDDWVAGTVVLVGDAAHACSPSMAQGGAMALEDALVLASTLGDGQPSPLARYRARRAGRIRFVLEQNHRRDNARNLPGFARRLLFRHFGLRLVRANHAGLLDRP
ncbi:FAD-dependent oxidoreductase [Paractinoplanes deccanensis]|uniref:FAD-dependent oxidoreductase n=1 Tax=Paractinoplanes deccanensis TaxID=113561 RepID=A0ABQ3YB26_9ACTN|nr:FAD-dependent monooxygenase [Actinoplanes deccanensis]GID77025.1 FAD-dependent oxidoreductase [Actinoplanes deccanensis]